MSAMHEVEFTDEEALLAQSAHDLLQRRSDFTAVRRFMETESGYDSALYREMAQLGWLGVAVPSEYGGAGLSVRALTSVAEAMGQRVLGSPFLASTLAAQALIAAGTEAQKQRYLPKLVSGEAIGTVAWSEPSGSYGLRSFDTTVRPAGDGYALRGKKTFVLDALHADFAIVAAQGERGPQLVVLEADALRGKLQRETLIDETRRSARLTLDGVRVAGDALLSGGDAVAALAHVERTGWLLLAAEMAGGAEGALQLTAEYLRTRKQFGKAIGSYQALKHPMVELMCEIEQGRSLLYRAATLFDQEGPEREVALRMAKAQLGETFAAMTDRAIQFHGAIGFTWECHAQLFFRRAQWAEHVLGDAPHHRKRIAELLWPM